MIRPDASRLRRRPDAILGIALSSLILASPDAALAQRDADNVRATARQVLVDGYYQYEAPGQREAPALAAENEISSSADPRTGEGDAPRVADQRKMSLSSQIGTAFLWVLAGVAGLLFAFQSIRLLRARLRRAPQGATGAAVVRAGAADATEHPLLAADRLAQAGSSGEAVRRLLLAALEALRRRLGGTVAAPALTAREVMRTPMPARARAALAILVESEERGRFGGRVVVPATYRACRACYVRFTAWLEARAA
jgi:hypothetical protein